MAIVRMAAVRRRGALGRHHLGRSHRDRFLRAGPLGVASGLGAIAARAALERPEIDPGQTDHVVFGNVIHTEPAGVYMARVVGVKAGFPTRFPPARSIACAGRAGWRSWPPPRRVRPVRRASRWRLARSPWVVGRTGE
ncbi:MAG: hypothetical protein M3022_04345 [Actinomycetota bacterium]|nr:hypothetical protein [Actinomycetota bacterium]